MHEWLQLLSCSGLYGVEITRLRDCLIGSRLVFGVDMGPHWDTLRVFGQQRLVLRDARLGLFIETPGEPAELEGLAREIRLRQAVDHCASGAHRFFFGPHTPWNQESQPPPMFPEMVN